MRQLALVAALLAGTAHSAFALTITGSTTTPDPLPGAVTAVDLSGRPTPSQTSFGTPAYTVSFSGTPSNQGVVTGNSDGQYATPIAAPGTPLAGNYLSVGNAGHISIAFTADQAGLSLLWGSIDTYNSLQLLRDGVVVATVTGTQAGDAADVLPNGGQGFGGSAYITLTGVVFDEARFLSTANSFEFGLVLAAERGFAVPAPGALALLGAGLFGLGVVARPGRRARPASA